MDKHLQVLCTSTTEFPLVVYVKRLLPSLVLNGSADAERKHSVVLSSSTERLLLYFTQSFVLVIILPIE